ncbi:MAG: phage baseplate protein [Staphylococcus saprophyticus]
MYYTNFPVELGREYRMKMVSNFVYLLEKVKSIDSVIYKHSHTDQHAHSSKQIDYKKTNVENELIYLRSNIIALVLGTNGNGIQELRDSRIANDGTRHELLADRLRHDYFELNSRIDTLLNDYKAFVSKVDNKFKSMDITELNVKPKITASLDSDVPLQSFLHAGKDIAGVRLIPSKKTVEDYYLFKFSRNGDKYDAMRINGGTHLENIGYYNGWFIAPIFTSNGINGKIIAFKYHSNKNYKPYKSINYSDEDTKDVKSFYVNLESKHVNVNVYKKTLNIFSVLSKGNGINLKQYDVDKFLKGEYKLLNEVIVAKEHTNLSWLQGIVATDEHVFVSAGDYNYGSNKNIAIYSTKNGGLVDTISTNELGSEDFEGKPINNWNEPEGMDITMNYDGTYNVHLGMFTGGSTDTVKVPTNKRFHIYTWAPKSNPHALINDVAMIHSNLASKDRLLFYGDVTGNVGNKFELTDKVFNYKFLTFYFSTGFIGTHTVTVPADRFRFTNYIDLQNMSITEEGVVYNYSLRISFDDVRKKFNIKHARGIKYKPDDPKWSGTGGLYDKHPSIHLYHIRGYGLTPSIQDI